MSEPIIGNYFGFYMGGKRIALAQSKSTSVKTKVEDITTDDSRGFDEVIPAEHSISSSVDGLVTAALDNMVQFPEDLSQSIWTKDTGVAITAMYGDDRYGQKHANRVVWNAGAFLSQPCTNTGVNNYVLSCDMKGSGNVEIEIVDESLNSFSETITLTSEWTRVSVAGTGFNPGDDIFFKLNKGTATELQITNMMINEGTDLLDYKGSEYTAQQLHAAEKNKTLLTVRQSSDLSGDMQLAFIAYITGFDLKTKDATVNGFSCNIQGRGVVTITTI